MQPSAEYFVPVSNVRSVRVADSTVLSAAGSDQGYTLSEAGEQVWAMLQERGRTVDRLVIALARRSSGQALAAIPDHVVAELDDFITRGLVERIVV
jgi:phage baseplate assembly protein gpV